VPFNPNAHHRRSTRLRGFDYAGPATYFVTLCTFDRRPLFGAIVGGDIVLSPIGEIVVAEWERSAGVRPEVLLDEFVVMPNHLHAILSIGARPMVPADPPATDPGPPSTRRPTRSLGSFVAGFKAATTSRVRTHLGDPTFAVWQRNYHDHIVRSEAALVRIRNYVWTNPLRWHLDRENRERCGQDEFDAWLDTL